MSNYRIPDPSEDRSNYINALEIIAEVSEDVLQDLGQRVVRSAENFISFTYAEHIYDTLFDSNPNPEVTLPPIAAAELCELFGWMGKDLVRKGRAQYGGNHIYPHIGGLRITDRSEKQGRVTHVRLTDRVLRNNRYPVTHEIHFPSRDSGAKDYEVAGAIFVKHEYNEDGEKSASTSRFVETIEPQDTEGYDFIANIQQAYKEALSVRL